MALNLKDFQTSALSLQDFEGQLPLGKTVNKKTASVLAAQQAAVQGAQTETYEQIRDRLLDPEAQGEFTANQQRIRDAMWKDFVEPGVPDIIADPNIDPQTKDQLVSTALIPQDGRRFLSSTSTLALQAVRADTGVNTTEQTEESRWSLTDSIELVNQQKQARQHAINELELSRDQSIGEAVVDLAEIVTPFAEWIHVDQLLKDVTGEGLERSGALGEQKKRLYETIRALPMDQRAAFTERLLSIVQDNENIILPDGNDMMSVETLNRMLIDNDYSNFERWFDNATSVLDTIGVGGLVRSLKGIRSARALRATESAAEAQRARRVVEGAERTSTAVGRVEESVRGNFTINVEGMPTPQVGKLPFDDLTVAVPENLRRAMAESTRSSVSPASPSQVVKDFNPDTAREMHRRMVDDETGETARALYGTTREEAIAKDILPEPEIDTGKMPNKVEMSKAPGFPEDPSVRKARLANGNTAVTEAEFAKVKERLVASFEDVEGMSLHPSSLVVRSADDGTFGITGRYSPTDSGFKTWAEALDNAKFGFRHYGLQEQHFVPLVRRGDEWVETTTKEIEARGALKAAGAQFEGLDDIDYAVGVKYDYRFRPEDLEIDEVLTTAPGYLARTVQFLDRAESQVLARLGQGSLVQNLLDPASVIHPQIVNPAHIAVDRAIGLKAAYQKLFEGFTDTYKKLPAERRTVMSDYIHQANLEGIPFSVTDLRARGFDSNEIAALKQWRRANDAMWYASNDDMAKTLRARGMKVYVHDASETKLIGRPLSRNAVSARADIFDSVEDSVTSLSKEQLDELYDGGGEIIKLSEPTQIDGRWVDHVMVRNTPSGGYTRSIYEGETVMPYRDGYYPVMYDANFFIEKQVKLSNGLSEKKVVASARDSGEVAKALEELRKTEPDAIFSSRKDRRLGQQDQLFDEGSWGHITNAGMSNQRVRGERLGDAGTDLHKMGTAHLKDPLEAIGNQIHQLSQRVSMRTYMETVKSRWMQNYADHLDLPINPNTGKVEFPNSVSAIKGKEGASPKIVADARTNFNYLYSLQNGYINAMDEIFKGIMHFGADLMGQVGFNKAQRALFEAGKNSPTRAGKTVAFKLFISSNPVRQAAIQRGQMLQLAVVNPTYTTTSMIPDLMGIDWVRLGVSKDPKYVKLFEEIKDSGVLEAVDAHTLLNERAMRLADLTTWQKTKGYANRPLEFLQKVGFDAAEQDVLLSAYLTFRDLAIKEGKSMKSQRVRDEVLGQARAFTGGMNRAGDMAYSQNSLGLAAQFFSFRHKMLLQTLSNRNLTPLKRAQMLAFNAALFGPDAAIATYIAKQLYPGEEPSPERDMIEAGLLDVIFNKGLTLATGEDQALDWGDFAPTEAYGTGNLLVGMITTDIGEMVANSPAGSLLFGGNARITDAFRTGMRYFNVIDDYDDPELQTKFSDVVIGAANMFSGFSNAWKARYALEVGKKISSSGNVSDEEITKVEAVLGGMIGLRTKDEESYRKAYEQLYGTDYSNSKDFRTDIENWYKELKRQLARRHQSTTEGDTIQRILSEAQRVFAEDRPRYNEVILELMQKDVRNRDYSMFQNLSRQMGLATEEEMWKMINALPQGNIRENLTTLMNAGDDNGT